MSPRSILKRSSYQPPTNYSPERIPNAVHFPPSPSLCRTFAAHPSSTYDRSPIVVAPNTCAMPERGCPGRTYTLEDQPNWTPASAGYVGATLRGHVHPRALEATMPPPPPLIPDLSSESDESDGFMSPPPEPSHLSIRTSSSSSKYTSLDIASSPYTTSPAYGPGPYYNVPSPTSPCPMQKARRRRKTSRSRSNSPPESPSSSRYGEVDVDDPGYDDDRDIASTPTQKSHRSKRRSLCKVLSSFSISGEAEDNGGCLGGF